MVFSCTINGLPVEAVYSARSVETIFLPLLRRLGELHSEKGRRILVMLAAPPGTGKSTLALFLQHLSESDPSLCPVTTIGMDGFHHYRSYLSAHSTLRDGQEIPLSRIKGAPETFDLRRLRERIERLRTGADTPWPFYDRMLHDPSEDAQTVTGDIVLLEGNYLLLDEPGWRELRDLADYTLRIDAPEAELYGRLVSRKAASGAVTLAQAEEHVRFSDIPNVRRCLAHSFVADLNLRMLPDGEYVLA